MFSKSTGILAQLPPVNELFVMLEKKMIQPVTEEKKKPLIKVISRKGWK